MYPRSGTAIWDCSEVRTAQRRYYYSTLVVVDVGEQVLELGSGETVDQEMRDRGR